MTSRHALAALASVLLLPGCVSTERRVEPEHLGCLDVDRERDASVSVAFRDVGRGPYEVVVSGSTLERVEPQRVGVTLLVRRTGAVLSPRERRRGPYGHVFLHETWQDVFRFDRVVERQDLAAVVVNVDGVPQRYWIHEHSP